MTGTKTGHAAPWTNWAGNQSSSPAEVAVPRRTDDVAAAILRARAHGIPVKAVGTGHSFTAVAATDGVQVRLDELTGVLRVDGETRRVRVGAGTIVGADMVAKSPADGYTFLLGDNASFANNVSLYRKLSYDPQADFGAEHHPHRQAGPVLALT